MQANQKHLPSSSTPETSSLSSKANQKGIRVDIIYRDGVTVPALYFRNEHLDPSLIPGMDSTVGEPLQLWHVRGDGNNEFVRVERPDVKENFSGSLLTPLFMFCHEDEYHNPELPHGVAFDFSPSILKERIRAVYEELKKDFSNKQLSEEYEALNETFWSRFGDTPSTEITTLAFKDEPAMTIEEFSESLPTAIPY